MHTFAKHIQCLSVDINFKTPVHVTPYQYLKYQYAYNRY